VSEVIYRIGRLSEDEEIELNFMDGLSRSVEERIKIYSLGDIKEQSK
jgi:hypothetical protein